MKGNKTILYVAIIAVAAVVTIGIMFLLGNINQRKEEARQDVFRVVDITEETLDPAVWGKNYPRQYDGYLRTVDTERTRYGGSEDFQKLDEDPVWRDIFAGYAFALDYREDRGHAYMLSDQEVTKRVTEKQQPGACLQCHSNIIPAYQKVGLENGAPAGEENREAQIQKGFEIVSGMPYQDAHQLVSGPIGCGDCHDPETMALRVTRPGFLNGIRELANSDVPTPHLPSIETWRKGGKQGQYEPNTMANRQEMRSYVCGQCHVEYYFKGESKVVTYPWDNGLTMEGAEKYYNDAGFKDWEHKLTGAPSLKAQHPEFELWSQGIHAASGVACADCHMPYTREGAVKISDHHVRSPMLNINNACQTCHNFSEEELANRVNTIQDRTNSMMTRAEEAIAALIGDLQAARDAGMTPEQLAPIQDYQRKAQWRLDYIAAENSMGFHAPQEATRILGEAIDYARQGQLELSKLQMPTAMVK